MTDDDYLSTLIEQRIAEMGDDEFDALVTRTRPPRLDPVEAAKANATPALRNYHR